MSGLVDLHGAPLRPQMKWRAAENNRDTKNLYSVCQRPEEELKSADLSVLRARCRYVVKNYPQAAGAVDLFVRRIGTRLRIQSRLRTAGRDGKYLEDENDKIEAILKNAWRSDPHKDYAGFTVEGDSFADAMRTAMRTRYVDGEVFFIKATNSNPQRVLAREWQIIDADQVADNAYHAPKNIRKGNTVVQGIEFNAKGRPVAYHFYDDGKSRWYFSNTRTIRRIPADRVIHWFRKVRPGQVRGIPEIAQTLLGHADVEEFSKAKIQAEWVANSFAALVRSENPLYSGIAYDDSATAGDGTTTYSTEISSGMIQNIPDGTVVDFANPNRPGGDMEGFVRVYQRAIACAMGVSYEEYTRDFTNTNYSSARAALQDSRFTYEDWIEDIDANLIAPVYRDALNFIYFVHFLLPVPSQSSDMYAHEVQHPQPGWVDPMKEVQADVLAVTNNLTTLTERCAARGLDFSEVARKRSEENALLERLGLSIPESAQAIQSQSKATDVEDEDEKKGARIYAVSSN